MTLRTTLPRVLLDYPAQSAPGPPCPDYPAQTTRLLPCPGYPPATLPEYSCCSWEATRAQSTPAAPGRLPGPRLPCPERLPCPGSTLATLPRQLPCPRSTPLPCPDSTLLPCGASHPPRRWLIRHLRRRLAATCLSVTLLLGTRVVHPATLLLCTPSYPVLGTPVSPALRCCTRLRTRLLRQPRANPSSCRSDS